MLTDLRTILHDAPLARFAFNITSVEGFQALVAAGESTETPLILQCTERYIDDLGEDFVRNLVVPRLIRSPVSFVLHLDHGSSLAAIIRGIRLGCTSVMFDGSQLPLHDNAAQTAEIVRIARLAGVSVEGEIGHVGGAEDTETATEESLTTLEEAVAFVSHADVDVLAVAVGNAHGVYRQQPRLDIERIQRIANAVQRPLALHGGTGIPAPLLVQAARAGMRKINVGTELRLAWIEGARAGMAVTADLDRVRASIRAQIRRVVLDKLAVLAV